MVVSVAGLDIVEGGCVWRGAGSIKVNKVGREGSELATEGELVWEGAESIGVDRVEGEDSELITLEEGEGRGVSRVV